MDGYNLFRKDRQGKKGAVALNIKQKYTYSEAQYKVEGRPSESFWVKVKGDSRGDVIVNICFTPPNQEKVYETCLNN